MSNSRKVITFDQFESLCVRDWQNELTSPTYANDIIPHLLNTLGDSITNQAFYLGFISIKSPTA